MPVSLRVAVVVRGEVRITEIMEAFRLYRLRKNIKSRSNAGLAAIKPILEETIDVLITKQLGEISFHTLRDGFIDIYKTDAETAENVFRLFFDGKLKKLECYTTQKRLGGVEVRG